VNVRLVGAGNRQPHGLRTHRQQKAVVGHFACAGSHDLARFGVKIGDFGIEAQIDCCLAIEGIRTQRHPVLGSVAGKVVL
jgi:hypothetical protein